MTQHNQKPPPLDRGSRPSQEMREQSHYVREEELRRLRHSFSPGCGNGRVVLEGDEFDTAGATSIPLYHGTMEIGPDLTSIPIAKPTSLITVATSFRADSASDPWTLTLHYRPYNGTGGFSPVATFSVLTTPS